MSVFVETFATDYLNSISLSLFQFIIGLVPSLEGCAYSSTGLNFLSVPDCMKELALTNILSFSRSISTLSPALHALHCKPPLSYFVMLPVLPC